METAITLDFLRADTDVANLLEGFTQCSIYIYIYLYNR